MYILLTGIPPFYGDNDKDILTKVSMGIYSLCIPEFDDVSDLAKDLVKKMLEYGPDERVSAYDAINHEWFQEMRKTESKQVNLATLNNLKDLNVISLKIFQFFSNFFFQF